MKQDMHGTADVSDDASEHSTTFVGNESSAAQSQACEGKPALADVHPAPVRMKSARRMSTRSESVRPSILNLAAHVMPAGADAAKRKEQGAQETRSVSSWWQKEWRFSPTQFLQQYALQLRMLQLVYYLWTAPLRFGLFFDPRSTKESEHWTFELTIFSIADATTDLFGIVYCVHRYIQSRKPHLGSTVVHSPDRSRQSWPYLYATSRTRTSEHPSSRISLVLNLLALIPVEVVVLGVSYNLLHIVRLTKLLTLVDLPSVYSSLQGINLHLRAIQTVRQHVLARLLINLVLVGVVWMHCSAMIYMLIAHSECGRNLEFCSDDSDSWANRDQLKGSTLTRKYARVMYWASRTVITLGCSDMTPTTNIETIYVVLCETVGAIWSASLISAWAYWFSTMRNVEQTEEVFVYNVKQYLVSIEAPTSLQDRIVMFLQFQWMTTRNFTQTQFLEIVSQEHLQSCFRTELKTARLLQLPIFVEQSVGFVNAVASTMEMETHAPLNWVLRYPKTQSEMFVVLYDCVAIVSDAHQGKKVYTCVTGDSFGSIALFDELHVDERAFAETFVQVITLTKEMLARTLKSYYPDESLSSEVYQTMRAAAEIEYRDFIQRRGRQHMLPVEKTTDAITTPSYWEQQKEITERVKPWQHPQSTFRQRWEVGRCLGLLYLAIEVPYIVIFYYGMNGNFGEWGFDMTFLLSTVAEIFFYIDMYLTMYHFWIPPTPDRLGEASTPEAILAYYKSHGGFHLDVIAHLPMSFVIDFVDGFMDFPKAWDFLYLMRLLRFIRVRQLNEFVRATLHRLTGSVQFIIYCVLALFVYCHFIACMWYITGHFSLAENSYRRLPAGALTRAECLQQAQRFYNCSWTVMDGMEVEGVDMKDAYLRSFYYSITTFSTVAYGDIMPYNIGESWMANFVTFFGGIMCYCVIGAMGSAIAQLAHHGREICFQEHVVNRFLRKHSITPKLSVAIRRFYRYLDLQTQESTIESELALRLSAGLRESLAAHLHEDSARRIATCADTSEPFLLAVAGNMTRNFFYEKENLITAGDDPTKLYVVQSGRLRELEPFAKVTLRMYHEGMSVGEEQFISQDGPHRVHVEAVAITEVSVLEFAVLERLLFHYPEDAKKISDVIRVREKFRANSIRVRSASSRGQRKSKSVFNAMMSPRGSIQASTTRTDSMRSSESVAFRIGAITGAFRTRWEVLIAVTVLYNCFSITTRVIFIPEPSSAAMIVLTLVDWTLDVFLLADIYFKYNLFAPPFDIANKMTKEQIRTHYKRRWFFYDVVASVPLYYAGSNFKYMTWCRLPRLLRTLQMFELSQTIHSYLARKYANRRSHSLLGLVKVIALFMLCCHMGGSIFYAISSHEHNPRSWLMTDIVLNQYPGHLGVAYIRSFYWAMSSFTVLNYGDIVAASFMETGWACLICLTGTFFMSNVGSEMINIIKNLNRIAADHQHYLENFRHFAHVHRLPNSVHERASRYFHFKFEMHEGMDAEKIFSSLATQVRRQLMGEIYSPLLDKLSLFEPFSAAQKAEISAMLTSLLFLPKDIIVYEHSAGDALYIMKYGRAEAVLLDSGSSLAELGEDRVFGEIAFFNPEISRLASVRAITHCEVMQLCRDQWDIFSRRLTNEKAVKAVVAITQEGLRRYEESASANSSVAVVTAIHSVAEDAPVAICRESDTGSIDAAHFSNGMIIGTPQEVGGRRSVPRLSLASLQSVDISTAETLGFGTLASSRRNSDAPPVVNDASSKKEPQHQDSLTREASYNDARPVSPVSASFRASNATVIEMPTKESIFVETSTFRFVWDGLKLLATVYYLIAIPLRVAFFTDISELHASPESTRVWIAFEYVVDAFFVIDICLRLFHFRPVVRGVAWTNRRQCAWRYIRKGDFFLDVFASFPFEAISQLPVQYFRNNVSFTASIFRLEILVLCFQLGPLWQRIEYFVVYKRNVRVSQDVTFYAKIFLITFISAHWLACLWYFIGREVLRFQDHAWLNTPFMLVPKGDTVSITDVPLVTKYLRSFHYAVGSLSTVTYGDICARSLAETIIQVFISFLCIIFYAFLTGSSRKLFERHLGRRIAFEQQLTQVKQFAAHHRLSHGLAFRICKFLSDQWLLQGDIDQVQALEPLSMHLKCDILVDLRKALLHRTPNAFDGFSVMLVRAILSRLREEVFAAQDIVYEQFSTISHSMYFVETGVLLLRSQDRSIDQAIHPGGFCGEQAMLKGTPRQATCIAASRSSVAVLHRSVYEEVISIFPENQQQIESAWLIRRCRDS